MKNIKRFTVTLLFCFIYLFNNAQVGSGIFLASAYDYGTGLKGFNSVATQLSNTNAVFGNPALMVNSQLNVSLNHGQVEYPTFDYKGQHTDFVANQNFANHAFGTYFKALRQSDFVLNLDTIFNQNSYTTGLAYAYRFSSKWSIGTSLNYYTGQYSDKAIRNLGVENYHGLTFSFGGLYQDDFEINDVSSMNWSVGANINNLGQKNAPIPDRKDKEFMWTQGGIGTSLGYRRKAALHPFAVHTTLMYQLNYLLVPHYRDSNNDGIADRELMSALEGVLSGFQEMMFYNIQYYAGLEVNIILENEWNFGFRTTFARQSNLNGSISPALFIGYKNFYLSASKAIESNRILRGFDINQNGFSIGYNLPF